MQADSNSPPVAASNPDAVQTPVIQGSVGGGPIADLTYRSYDGPLYRDSYRWRVIAKQNIWRAIKNKWYWIWTVGSGLYFLIMMVIVFFLEAISTNVAAGSPNPMRQLIDRIVWKDQFLHGFGFGQLMFLFVLLIVGSGTIANDNRANALLVYLSKPCTRKDYLLGKWMGVFIPLFCAMLLPSLVYYIYGVLSYRAYGFLTNDPLVILKLPIYIALAAAFQSSLMVGISSLFSQGRMASVTYAGLYFLSNILTVLMSWSWALSTNPRHGGSIADAPSSASTLYYASIDGLQTGLAKAVLGTDGSTPFVGVPGRVPPIPAPSLWGCLAVIIAISALALVIAYKRIRAVEVVG